MFGSGFTSNVSDSGIFLGSSGVIPPFTTTTIPAASTYYAIPYLNGIISGIANFPIPKIGVLYGLSLRLNAPQPLGGSLIFRVVLDSSINAISITVPGGDATGTYFNNTDSYLIINKGIMRFEFQNNAPAVSPCPVGFGVFIK